MFDTVVSVIKNTQKPYSAVESWAYDRIVAPAVIDFTHIFYEVIGVTNELAANGNILEVGCGGGHLLRDLADRHQQARLTGLDLSSEQVSRARKRTASYGDRIKIVQGSALDLPFDSSCFDLVISIGSIKHWTDRILGMREILRVLKPSGSFYIVELDRGCRLDDATRFVDSWRLPLAVRRLALPIFRTFLAGTSIDLDDARQLLRDVGLPESGARRVPDSVGILISGIKTESTA
jgi:ubiquinone/menaquinone biosynthesis C-methylase UbiE